MPPRLALKLVLNHATKDSFVSDAHGQPPDRGCSCGEPLVNHTAVRGVIKQAWVGCDGCGRWCHAKCTNGGWRHKNNSVLDHWRSDDGKADRDLSPLGGEG